MIIDPKHDSDSSDSSSESISSSSNNGSGGNSSINRVGDWSQHISSSGIIYFYNWRTNESQWDPPREWLEVYPESYMYIYLLPYLKQYNPDGDLFRMQNMELYNGERHSDTGGRRSTNFCESQTVGSSSVTRVGDWSQHTSSRGIIYFYNWRTNESQWDPPREWFEAYPVSYMHIYRIPYPKQYNHDGDSSRVQNMESYNGERRSITIISSSSNNWSGRNSSINRVGEWSQHTSSSGIIYFYNWRTGESQWDPPREWIEAHPELTRPNDNDYKDDGSLEE